VALPLLPPPPSPPRFLPQVVYPGEDNPSNELSSGGVVGIMLAVWWCSVAPG
jgi:hypothetical protein